MIEHRLSGDLIFIFCQFSLWFLFLGIEVKNWFLLFENESVFKIKLEIICFDAISDTNWLNECWGNILKKLARIVLTQACQTFEKVDANPLAAHFCKHADDFTTHTLWKMFELFTLVIWCDRLTPREEDGNLKF